MENTDYTYDVFISYSPADRGWVQNCLVPRLKHANLRVCIEDSFDIGIPIVLNKQNAVQSSRHTILVLTPAWVESKWASFEGLLALDIDPAAETQRTLPLLRQPCDVPKSIAQLCYADFTDTTNLESVFTQLLHALQGVRHIPSPKYVTLGHIQPSTQTNQSETLQPIPLLAQHSTTADEFCKKAQHYLKSIVENHVKLDEVCKSYSLGTNPIWTDQHNNTIKDIDRFCESIKNFLDFLDTIDKSTLNATSAISMAPLQRLELIAALGSLKQQGGDLKAHIAGFPHYGETLATPTECQRVGKDLEELERRMGEVQSTCTLIISPRSSCSVLATELPNNAAS